MAINIADLADGYFTHEERLASFQTAQQVSKRRASNASSKAPKSIKWPHKFLAPEELSKAGFFYCPSQANPDNVACFLCHKFIGDWEDGDDPLIEHLKLSPDCGWAINAAIEQWDEQSSQEHPLGAKMIESRKATFSNRWPHETRKGWKCKVKQMVDAGWVYTPTPNSDDMATCAYCSLALDGWENTDKPLDEHLKRAPECSFFALINDLKASPAAKRTKTKKDRSSRVSRVSTQSAFTAISDTTPADLPAEDGDSILTTATNATAATQGGKKTAKGKKVASGKGKKTKSKKSEAVGDVSTIEPEDADFEVKVEVPAKATRGRKRKSDETVDFTASTTESQRPQPKRRATRSRASSAADDSVVAFEESMPLIDSKEPLKPAGRKGKGGRPSKAKSTRKASAASIASFQAAIPSNDEIDAALEADLNRPLTDEDEPAPPPPSNKETKSKKSTISDHEMFGVSPMDIDEAAIQAELQAIESESKPLPKAKGAKGKQTRKVSAKQQAAAAKKAALTTTEPETTIEELADEPMEDEASQQLVAEFEHSVTMQEPSPAIKIKKQPAKTRKASQKLPRKATRASVLSVNESDISTNNFQDVLHDHKEDSGDETDASMASQSTVIRGGSNRRGSTLQKARGGKKAASRNIEEIVNKPKAIPADEAVRKLVNPPVVEAGADESVDSVTMHETFEDAVSEVSISAAEDSAPRATKSIGVKAKGKPKKAQASTSQEASVVMDHVQRDIIQAKPTAAKSRITTTQPQSPAPQPKQITPAESPQSSDAENHPPSARPSASAKKTYTPQTTSTRVPLAASTPILSPSKRNVIARLQTAHPWNTIDLNSVFLDSPSGENGPGNGFIGQAMLKAKNGELTSPEKKMSVEEWIHYNAEAAEQDLRTECERMVGIFEREGGRAMRALEGLECIE